MATTIVDNNLSNRFSRNDDKDRSFCLGLIAALRQAMQDEHGAVNAYMEIAERFPKVKEIDVASVMQMIRDEEKEHEKELFDLIHKLEKECEDTFSGNTKIGQMACIEYKRNRPYVD